MAIRETYYCEDVSRIAVKGDTFFLTDKSGDTEITRAMSYATFAKCVRGAFELLTQFEAKRGGNITHFPGR